MMIRFRALSLLCCALFSFNVLQAHLFMTTDNRTLEGKLIRVKGTKVYIETVDGKRRTLSVKRLVASDRAYVKEFQKTGKLPAEVATKGPAPKKPGEEPMMEMEMMEMSMMMDGKVNVELIKAAHKIFKNHCTECHGEKKKKGSYRLDDAAELAYAGGESEMVAIIPGKPEKSEMFYRISLPHEDEDAMPPEKKSPLDKEQVATIKAWILAGAVWETGEEEVIKVVIPDYYPDSTPEIDAVLEKIKSLGARAEYTAWRDDTIVVNLSHAKITDWESLFKQLTQLKERLVWLDLKKKKVPEWFFDRLVELPAIQRLHLEGTNISDATLKKIVGLPKLNYLNICNTNVTDKGIAVLSSSRKLASLYIFRSGVTEAGKKALQRKKPKLKIIGLDILKAPPKPAEVSSR